MTKPIVSVVLGSYNRLLFLKKTIESVRKELIDLPHEIIVVDGGSEDGSLKWITEQKDIIAVIQHNNGYWKGIKTEKRSWGYFMNLGFRAAQGKYICMVSDDCLTVPGAIKNGLMFFETQSMHDARLAAVPFFWRNWPDDKSYRIGVTLGENIFVNHGLYLREALEKVGYIDEENYSFYHADGDLCLKLWNAGFICKESPDSYIEHYSHANIKARKSHLEVQKEDWKRYLDKWKGIYEENKKSWIEKDFYDISRTAEKFKYADIIDWFIVRKIRNVSLSGMAQYLPKPFYIILKRIYIRFIKKI